jgi:hypothetical protein
MKPDWKDAPAWAKWLAMDNDGTWFWYAEKPTLLSAFWNSAAKFEFASASEWDNSLEARPYDAERGED